MPHDHHDLAQPGLRHVAQHGEEPEVVEYLKTPPSRDELAGVAAQVGGARALLRVKGTPAAELGLDQPGISDAAILDAMMVHPILINRPVVFGPRGVVLARPSEKVLEVLDRGLPADFVKEDGERVAKA
jgi:arsenate reductase